MQPEFVTTICGLLFSVLWLSSAKKQLPGATVSIVLFRRPTVDGQTYSQPVAIKTGSERLTAWRQRQEQDFRAAFGRRRRRLSDSRRHREPYAPGTTKIALLTILIVFGAVTLFVMSSNRTLSAPRSVVAALFSTLLAQAVSSLSASITGNLYKGLKYASRRRAAPLRNAVCTPADDAPVQQNRPGL